MKQTQRSLADMQGRLSRSEMKNVMGGSPEAGGSGTVFCTCSGSGSTPDAVACAFTTFQGGFNCVASADRYCRATYGVGATCDIKYGSPSL